MCYQVIPILALLQTAESHLRAGNVLLWVFEVFEQRGFVPSDSFRLVRVGIREPLNLTGLAPKETVQVGTDFVSLALA